MMCCENCFKSKIIKDKILSIGKKSDCNFCGSKNVNIILPNSLSEYFFPIIDAYTKAEHGGAPIQNKMYEDFDFIFEEDVDIKKLLQSILGKDLINDYKYLFEQNVWIKVLDTETDLEASWDKLKETLKRKRRFHVDVEAKEYFEDAVTPYEKTIEIGTEFYRGRISRSRNGYKKDKMGMPTLDKAQAGRINPEGIPYLYLADSKKTVIHEIRSVVHDYISIGTFKCKSTLKLLDLRDIKLRDIDIFGRDDNKLEKTILNKKFAQKLSDELSKPNRRHDSHLEYLVTQYLSEHIRDYEPNFDGIIYRSSMHKKGSNYALFSEEKVKCINVEVYEVKSIDFKCSPEL